MHRPTAGILAIVLLVLGMVLSFGVAGELGRNAGAYCLKFGLVVGVLWFAEPQLKQLPWWAVPALLLGVMLVIRRPKMLPWVLVAAAILAVIRPKGKKPNRPPRRAAP